LLPSPYAPTGKLSQVKFYKYSVQYEKYVQMKSKSTETETKNMTEEASELKRSHGTYS
jgi:hypothetical protein